MANRANHELPRRRASPRRINPACIPATDRCRRIVGCTIERMVIPDGFPPVRLDENRDENALGLQIIGRNFKAAHINVLGVSREYDWMRLMPEATVTTIEYR